jgi:succinate dehydrogenase/fumarate reductase flavoprotein subunit
MGKRDEGSRAAWPYPVRYGTENQVAADVLVIGGGLAGAHAAIQAARKGLKVVVVEKAMTIRAGSAGTGVDHWHDVCEDPTCKVSAKELAALGGGDGEYPVHAAYMICKESFDTLLELEEMGLSLRDLDGEFAGAPFRDDETGLMYAYDYRSRHCIRVRGGAKIKPVLYDELTRLEVTIMDRVMVTSLLTEEGRLGGRVVGATGVHTRTGEFFIFSSKAVVLTTGPVTRLWTAQTELVGKNDELFDPCCTGDGQAAAWNAGAEFIDLELGGLPFGGGFAYPPYGVGNPDNTWFPCTIVDAEGKEIPWEDGAGRRLGTVEERTYPFPGQEYFLCSYTPCPPGLRGPHLIDDLPDRIAAGEYKLPLYADLPGMPEYERRAIWGLMVGNEGKTNIAVYNLYNKAGFNPDKDMLQANVIPPRHLAAPWWKHYGPPQWMESSRVGRLLVDWDLRTTLEGLYAAGQTIGGPGASAASGTGRYAGRKAADYAAGAVAGSVSREQVEREMARAYSQLSSPGSRWTGWKELHFGIARVMQDYCGVAKSESLLVRGLEYLASIRESEASSLWARNPHELVRGLETLNRLVAGEMVLHGTLARRGSNPDPRVSFERLDYPDFDPEEWKDAIVLQLRQGGEIGERKIIRDYMLRSPYAATLEENYRAHAGL